MKIELGPSNAFDNRAAWLPSSSGVASYDYFGNTWGLAHLAMWR